VLAAPASSSLRLGVGDHGATNCRQGLDVFDKAMRSARAVKFLFGNVDGIPFQAGYTIGFEIVQAYLAAHPEQPPQVWSRLDPTEILSGSGFDPESNTGTSE